MICASCFKPMTAVGKTWRCACGAAWVPEAAFVEMVAVMREGTVPIPWHERAGDPRPCPQCQASMRTVALADIPLDRCDSHGIWFDGDELQRVLQRASAFEIAEGPQRSLLESKGFTKVLGRVLGALFKQI